MKSKACLFLAFFWFCCAPFLLFAQHEESLSRIYSMKDGLPDEGVNCVMQDSRGFIWLGTYSGICRFDGYRFTTYRNNPASANSLRNNRVSSIWEDKVVACGLVIRKDLMCSIQEPKTLFSIGPIRANY